MQCLLKCIQHKLGMHRPTRSPAYNPPSKYIDVSQEDRKDLLGHKSGDVTTDYSAAELTSLIKAANLIVRSKDSPTLTVIRLVA